MSNLNVKKVLVVNEMEINRNVMAEMLSEDGTQVETAASGVEAVAKINTINMILS